MSEPHLNPNSGAPRPSGSSFDMQIVVQLIRNPFQGLALSTGSQWLYGLLGIVASIVGFALWTTVSVSSIFTAFLNPLAALTGGGGVGFGVYMGMFFRMIVLAFISQGLLIGSIWVFGNWLGSRKYAWRDLITYLGGAQWLFGGGYIAAAIIGLLLSQIGFLLAIVTLVLNLIFIVIAALEIYAIESMQKRAELLLYAIGSYVLVLGIVSSGFFGSIL
ncbi:hypothetical protein [Paenibacillus guangzhouensis]|uniref:hypothetical protein n=1 Tax=Paenibacillus guangzhouensis TaxID=1473112 RepID=UPI00126764C6|nr:hypothetical protein [Paenibacillus guangzhouensis]